MFTSPGFVMGLVAVEFLYGLFLFAVVSTNKRHRAEAERQAQLYAQSAPAGSPFVPKVEAEPPPAPPAEASAEEKEKELEKVAEAESTHDQEKRAEKTKESRSATQAAKVAAAEREPRKESEPKKKPKKARGKRDQSKELALATPEPAPTKPDEALKKSASTLPPLGPLIDPLQDSQTRMTDDIFTIQVAGGPHIFDPNRGIADAPRSLTEIQGDFTAEVKVLGDLQPGTEPLKGLGFTFQGAGLLLWHNQDNYIRFERAAAYTGDRLQWIFTESCKDGKLSKQKPLKVREGAATLRLERRDNVINYTYSVDGKTWLKVDQAVTSLPPKISIGLSASNVSPRPFPAKFTNFVLKPGQ